MLDDEIDPADVEPSPDRKGVNFAETRSGRYYAKLGYLTGLGRSSVEVAEAMGDGIHPAYVRTLWRRWRFETHQPRCLVPLTIAERALLTWRAEKLGITPEEWLRRIAAAAIRDGLYEAIVDDTPKPAKCPTQGGDRKSAAFRASRGLE